jgi:hypothetical protein
MRARWGATATAGLAFVLAATGPALGQESPPDAGAETAGSRAEEPGSVDADLPDGAVLVSRDEFEEIMTSDPLGRHDAVGVANVLSLTYQRSPLIGADMDATIAAYRRSLDTELYMAASSSFWASDTNGFTAAARFRDRDVDRGWTVGLLFAFSQVDLPDGAAMDPPRYFNLGVTIGHYYRLGPALLYAEAQPNLLQLAGSGSREGTYRGSPVFASADLPLFFGLFVQGGGGLYLGDGVAPVWSATVGWRLVGPSSAFIDH